MEEIADREDASHTDFPPLYETLDPQALEELIESVGDNPLTIEFDYNRYTVRVYGNGTVEVRDVDVDPD